MEENPYAIPLSIPLVSKRAFPWRSFLFCTIWSGAILYLIPEGMLPDPHRFHNEMPRILPFPWHGIIKTALLMIGQAIVFYAIIRPETYVLQINRTSLALVANIGSFIFLGSLYFPMHAPRYEYLPLHWLLLHGLGLVALLAMRKLLDVWEYLRG